jgi:RibD C-terminal domain
VLKGDVLNEVTKLKHELNGEIVVPASFQLVHALMEHDLVDELRLKIFPVVLGAGKRLFGETSDKKALAPRRHSDCRGRRGCPHLQARPRRLAGGRASPPPRFSTEAVHTAARVNVTCVTPLGEETASTA